MQKAKQLPGSIPGTVLPNKKNMKFKIVNIEYYDGSKKIYPMVRKFFSWRIINEDGNTAHYVLSCKDDSEALDRINKYMTKNLEVSRKETIITYA